MVQISESLSSITREEKASLNGLFDRETRREKALELLDREARLRAKNKKNIKCIPRLIRSLGMQRFTQMGHQLGPVQIGVGLGGAQFAGGSVDRMDVIPPQFVVGGNPKQIQNDLLLKVALVVGSRVEFPPQSFHGIGMPGKIVP